MQFAPKYRRAFVRHLVVAVAMVSVMPVLSLSTGTVLAAPSVAIPDDNLRAALESNLGRGEGAPITGAELAGLTEFTAPNKSIADLTGIELCTNLEVLYLDTNNISDISALASLTKLQYLFLWDNTISDISGLASLTNLSELYLHHNSISDISALAELTKLDKLGLDGNSISDISALAELNNLSELYLHGLEGYC